MGPLSGSFFHLVKRVDFAGNHLSMASSILFWYRFLVGAWNSAFIVDMGFFIIPISCQYRAPDKAVLPLRLFKDCIEMYIALKN